MSRLTDNTLTPSQCPRCGGSFGCGASRPNQPCPCTSITLSAELQARLRERWRDCLCLDCLATLSAQPADAPLDVPAGSVAR